MKVHPLLFVTAVLCLLFLSPGFAAAVEIPFVTDDTVASNVTNGQATAYFPPFPPKISDFTMQYYGSVQGFYDPGTTVLTLEDFVIHSDSLLASFVYLGITVEVELTDIVASPIGALMTTVDPGTGAFALEAQLSIDVLATIIVSGVMIWVDRPMTLTGDSMNATGDLQNLGDTEGYGQDNYTLKIQGPLSFTVSDIPDLPGISVVAQGDLDLGFSGEEMSSCRLDVDGDEFAMIDTDLVFIYRCMSGNPEAVPAWYRDIQEFPPDEVICGKVGGLCPAP